MNKGKLQRILYHLELIAKIKNPQLRRKVLEHFANDKAMFDALSEVCLNVAHNKISFSPSKKRILRRYKKCIVSLAQKKKGKKKLMVGSGPILSLIVPAAISLISELLRRKNE